MILNSPYISGSLTVTGNTTLQGALTVTGSLSGTASTASFALTLDGTGSVGFATTGAFAATSGSASSRLTQIEQVYATTGSNSFRATQSITGSLTVTGQIIAQTLNVQQVTSSIVYSSGSNVFGCDINSRQTFTGSFYQTGSVASFSNCITSGGSIIANAAIGAAIIIAEGSATNGEGTISVRGKNSSGTSRRADFKYDNSDVIRLGTSSPIAMQFETGDSARLTISSTGAATFTCSVTATQFNVSTSGGATQIYNTGGGHTVITNACANKDMNYQTSGTGGHYFNTAGTDRLVITSTGFVGINQGSPTGYFHVTSCGVTPTSPSWPIYNAETDSVARNIYLDTAGNGSCTTAGRGATVGIVMGGYFDSRAVITTRDAGSGSPSDQGQGRGKDLLIKAGTADNTNGFKGGRLFLNGGMGFAGGAFNTCVGTIIMQGISSGGVVAIGNNGIDTQKLRIAGDSATSSAYSLAVVDSNASDLFSIRNDGLITFWKTISVWTTGNSANTWLNPISGDIYRSTSSLKYKKNIQNYTKGLSEIMQLRPVSYEGKHDVDEGRTFAGLIAEEVHDLGLSEFVQYAEDGSPDALAYSNMISLLIKGMQEQQCTINSLKTCLGIS